MMDKSTRKYVITAAIGLAIAVSVTFLRGIIDAETLQDTVLAISDGACVAGVMLVGAGLLVWTSGNGVFDGFTYSVRQTFYIHWPRLTSGENISYSDYCERKHKKKTSVRHLMIIGGIFILIAAVCTVLYNVLPE